MRFLSAACAALMFSVIVGFVAPASAALISITDVVSGPTPVLNGPANAFSYTHDLSPPSIPGPTQF
jgi:hypothetical protein